MNIFNSIILLGRPASGKSEILDFLAKLDPAIRRERFHIGTLVVLDDFPMLWTWFEEDSLLEEKFHLPRLHTDEAGYFKYPYLWHLLIERLDLEYHKRIRDKEILVGATTTIVEFSRGSEHGGYAEALSHFSDEVLSHSGIVYVRVSYPESLRKNRSRFNPDRPDSILEHGLPDEKIERLYREDDWETISAKKPNYIDIRGWNVPYCVFENEDDVTTHTPDLLATRLETVLADLYTLMSTKLEVLK